MIKVIKLFLVHNEVLMYYTQTCFYYMNSFA